MANQFLAEWKEDGRNTAQNKQKSSKRNIKKKKKENGEEKGKEENLGMRQFISDQPIYWYSITWKLSGPALPIPLFHKYGLIHLIYACLRLNVVELVWKSTLLNLRRPHYVTLEIVVTLYYSSAFKMPLIGLVIRNECIHYQAVGIVILRDTSYINNNSMQPNDKELGALRLV